MRFTRDAALFTQFCQSLWMVGDLYPLIYQVADPVYREAGITFLGLQHLDSIGLISHGGVSSYSIGPFPKIAVAYYYGTWIQLEFPADSNQLDVGHALLTSVGTELAPICGSSMNKPYFQSVLEHWSRQGIIVSTFLGSSPDHVTAARGVRP